MKSLAEEFTIKDKIILSKRLWIVLLLLTFGFLFGLMQCSTTINYLEANAPIYISNEYIRDTSIKDDTTLTVVSFNIERGEKISEAISLINQHEVLRDADVFLLQEMNENAMEVMSDALEMNYLFFPINKDSGLSFGNGILTRDSLFNSKKTILPYKQWYNDRRRGSTSATIMYHGQPIKLVSGHLATVANPASERLHQVDSLINAANVNDESILSIVGADFNIVSSAIRNEVAERFFAAGFQSSTLGLGATARTPLSFINPELDLIFTKNATIIDKGKIEDNTSSDHFPVWATIAF